MAKWYNNRMANIHAVIFDLYGVLGLNGWQDFKERHFHDRWEAWEPLRQLGQRVDAGEVTDDAFVSAIAAATDESCETVRYQFEHTKPNRELLQFIREKLASYKIGLLSNTSRDVLPGIFSDAERQLFDATVLSVSTGLTKPDPAMFHTLCEKLGVMPDECLMVDDQERHLVTAASLGMVPILFQNNQQALRTITEGLAA